MKSVRLTDVTLRELPLVAKSVPGFRDTIEIARLLDALGFNTIECASLKNIQEDSLLLKAIAAVLKQSVLALPVGTSIEQLEKSWAAVQSIAGTRLQIILPLSTVKMEYELQKKPQEILELITLLTATAKELTSEVEFIAEDATRAASDFLLQAVERAIKAGAKKITFCDRQDAFLPVEFSSFLKKQFELLPALEDVSVGIQCSSSVNLAEANALAALNENIAEIKTSAIGLAGIANGIHLAAFERLRTDISLSTGLAVTEAEHLAKQIEFILNDEEKSPLAVIANASKETDEVIEKLYTAEDEAATIYAAIAELGYNLTVEDQARVYKAFLEIASGKMVSIHELDVIIADTAMQVSPTYILEHYSVTESGGTGAFCQIVLGQDGESHEGLGSGNGPIDAAFSAIERIIGHRYELDDFQIKAITQGHEALGAAFVRLRYQGLLFSGTGISTDIVGSSIRAYLNALNKIANEEKLGFTAK